MSKRGLLLFLLLTVVLIALGYYSQLPLVTIQQMVAVGLIHGVLEWLPVDSFGYFPRLAYSYLGFSGSVFETLIPYLKLGSIFVVLLKLIEDVLGVAGLLLARAWDGLLDFLPIEKIANVLAGFVAVFASSHLLLLSGFFTSLQPYLLELFGEVTNLSLGVALIVVGLIGRRMRGRVERSQVGVLTKLNLGQFIVAGLVVGMLSLPGVNSGSAGFAVLTLGGFQPEVGLRIQYVMMIPIFARVFLESYSTSLTLPIGLTAVQVALIVFAVVYFGYITLSILIAIAKRLGAPETCILFGLILLAVFTAQSGASGRFWELISILQSRR